MSWEEGTPAVPDDTVSIVPSCWDLFILGDVLGVGNNDIVERVQLKFCKIILHVQKRVPLISCYTKSLADFL